MGNLDQHNQAYDAQKISETGVPNYAIVCSCGHSTRWHPNFRHVQLLFEKHQLRYQSSRLDNLLRDIHYGRGSSQSR